MNLVSVQNMRRKFLIRLGMELAGVWDEMDDPIITDYHLWIKKESVTIVL